MDYIRRFDIVLDRDYYYAGETLKGNIVVENMENIKVRGKINSKDIANWILLTFALIEEIYHD